MATDESTPLVYGSNVQYGINERHSDGEQYLYGNDESQRRMHFNPRNFGSDSDEELRVPVRHRSMSIPVKKRKCHCVWTLFLVVVFLALIIGTAMLLFLQKMFVIIEEIQPDVSKSESFLLEVYAWIGYINPNHCPVVVEDISLKVSITGSLSHNKTYNFHFSDPLTVNSESHVGRRSTEDQLISGVWDFHDESEAEILRDILLHGTFTITLKGSISYREWGLFARTASVQLTAPRGDLFGKLELTI